MRKLNGALMGLGFGGAFAAIYIPVFFWAV